MQACPDSEGFHKELHFCYLNTGKLADMQKLSMQLFKRSDDPTFAVWAALTGHLVATRAVAGAFGSEPLHAPLPKPASMALRLSSMMLSKGHSDLTSVPASVFSLAVHTLRRQGSFPEALELLARREEAEAARGWLPTSDSAADDSERAGQVLQPADLLRERVDLQCAAGQWRDAWVTYVQLLLVVDGDDWAYVTGLVEAACMCAELGYAAELTPELAALLTPPGIPTDATGAQVHAAAQALGTGMADARPSLAACVVLLTKLSEQKASAGRGPLLGLVYIALRMLHAEQASASAEGSPVAAQLAAAWSVMPSGTLSGALTSFTCSGEPWSKATGALVKYLEGFAHKACAVPDLHTLLAPWTEARASAGAGGGGASQAPSLSERGPLSTHPPVAEDVMRGDGCVKASPVATPFSPLRRYARAARAGPGWLGWASKPSAAAEGAPAFALAWNGTFAPGLLPPAARTALVTCLAQIARDTRPTEATVQAVTEALAAAPASGSGDGEASESSGAVPDAVLTATRGIQTFTTAVHLSLLVDCLPQALDASSTADSTADTWWQCACALSSTWRFCLCTHKAKAAQRGVLPGDELPLLASEAMVRCASARIKDTSDKEAALSILTQAIALCELALDASEHNFQLKLQLMRLYALTGSPVGHFVTFKSLDMKQMQYDSLQAFALPAMLAYGQVEGASKVALRTCSMHKDITVEVPQNTKTAYAKGNCAPALDFDSFGRRMKSSLSLAAARAANGLVALPSRSPVEARDWLKAVVLGGEWPDGVMESSAADALNTLVDNTDVDVLTPTTLDDPAECVAAARWRRQQRVQAALLLQAQQQLLLWALQHNAESTVTKAGTLQDAAAALLAVEGEGVGCGMPMAFGGTGVAGSAWDVCSSALTYPGKEYASSCWGCLAHTAKALAATVQAGGPDLDTVQVELGHLASKLEGLSAALQEAPPAEFCGCPRVAARAGLALQSVLATVPLLLTDLFKALPTKKKAKKGKKKVRGGKAAGSSDPSADALKLAVSQLQALGKAITDALKFDPARCAVGTVSGPTLPALHPGVDEDAETVDKCFDMLGRNFRDGGDGMRSVVLDRLSVLRGVKV